MHWPDPERRDLFFILYQNGEGQMEREDLKEIKVQDPVVVQVQSKKIL